MRGRIGVLLLVGIGWGLAFTPPAWGWGKEGHIIVAKIAELNLSPEAQTAIHELLSPGARISDDKIANFADFVRHNPHYPQYANTAPWHFVDTPYEATSYDPDRDCKENACAVGKIEDLRKVLADKSAPHAKRQTALIFLVHLVGDVHQPLHCATRNDRGGNMLAVTFLGQSGNHLNLHSVWDDNLVLACMGALDEIDYANRLNANMTAAQRTELAQGTTTDWANESHSLAVQKAYRDSNDNPLPTEGTPNLDQGYVDRGKGVVELQLRRGGVRLAKILNEALAP